MPTQRKATDWLSIVLISACLAAAARAGESQEPLPDAWLARWRAPAMDDRPLQIVHAIDPRRATAEGIDQMVPQTGAGKVEPKGMGYYADLGLGGIVCNVAFKDYLRSEEHWNTLAAGVEACRRLGLVVWLYDEDGYPSGAAGGLVLEHDRAFEAMELAFDASRDEPFAVRPAYEHTHASNNYYAARRYANLIDDRAVWCFIAKTHEAYWQRLEPYFGTTIRATFTDEPSLMAVNLGQIPEPARSRVRVVDPIDASVKALPTVPWVYDLPERYRERYGEDLLAGRPSLFAGDSPDDRKVRRQFWALIADLIAERFFGAIQEWCAGHRVLSSGHTLSEESILRHVPLEGNALEVLGRMDVPGLDMLTSDPEAVVHSAWLTAALPSSAALLGGGRRVMTEVSDFSQKMGGHGPADPAAMRATAAWQAAWGVTDFTLYYGINDRPADDYRAYCEYVGRLNAILKPARFDRRVLLYYPIHDLWEEYLPVAEPLHPGSQSARAQAIIGSFMRLGQMLQRTQIPFALIDHKQLAAAEVEPGGYLTMAGHRFEALVVPRAVQLPGAAAGAVDRFRGRGGRVVDDEADDLATPESLADALAPPYRLDPASDRITLGQYVRDGRRVLLIANAGREPYEGYLAAAAPGAWHRLDPADGSVGIVERDAEGRIAVSLPGRCAILLVASPPRGK
jgi:hypothetical protein